MKVSATKTKRAGKHINRVGLVLLILAAIGFCLWLLFGPNGTKKAPYMGPVEKLRVSNIGEFSIFDLIAQEKGYFTDNGLDVDIRTFDVGPPAVAALAAGEVDIAVAADFVGVRSIFDNDSLRILTQASKHQVFQALGRTDKGITMPADLKGKKIGVTKKSAGEFYLGRFLASNNIALHDVTTIDLPPGDIISQLETGQIDAAVVFDPHAYNIKHKLGDKLVSWSAQGSQSTFALTYSTEKFVTENPALIERYLDALIQAETYAKENPEEARALTVSLLGYDPAYVDYLWQNARFQHGLDQELLIVMEDQARWTINNGLTDKKRVPNYLNYIYFDGLDKVKPEAVTIIR